MKVRLDMGGFRGEAARGSPCAAPLNPSDSGSGGWAPKGQSELVRGCSISLPSPSHRHKQGCSSLLSSVPLLSWARQGLAPCWQRTPRTGSAPHPSCAFHTFTHPLFMVPHFFPSEACQPHGCLTHFLTHCWMWGGGKGADSHGLLWPWCQEGTYLDRPLSQLTQGSR